MSLFVLLAALAWEHYHPLAEFNPVTRWLQRYADWLGAHFNGGQPYHGFLAWGMGALLPALAAGLAGVLLGSLNVLLAWAWGVVVLYFCLGYKQTWDRMGEVAAALRAGDLDLARQTLKAWRGGSVEAFGQTDVAKVAVEEALRSAFARLIGVIFWFVLLGPLGAVLYRSGRQLRDHWQAHMPERGDFLGHVDLIVRILDWLPARAAAVSFAIVGSFQGALDCWRSQAWQWWEKNEGVVLAAGAGALGVRLGGPLPLPVGTVERAELGTGHDADADYLEGAQALIGRTVLLWVAVLVLLKLGELAA